jgi:tetratricopeptide (TPR) repeat protein
VAAALILVTVLVFANSVGNGFVYDDMAAIEMNDRLDHPADLGTFFTTGYWSDGRGALYRPLTLLSFAWDRALFGPGPFGVHLVNVVANALLAAAVFGLLRVLTGTTALAALAALLFAIHPVHTEVVANGVGRAEILSALFGALAGWIHFRLAAGARTGPGLAARLQPFAPPVLYLVALGFKESAAVFPLLFYLGEWLVLEHGRLPRGSAVVSRFIAYLPPLVLFLLLRGMVVGNALPEIQEVMAGLEPAGRVLFALATLLVYVGQLAVPWTLCAEYSDYRGPLPSTPDNPLVAGALVAVAAGVFLTVWLIRRKLWLPLFGIAWLILRIHAWKREASALVLVLVLGFYGWRTVTRNAEWKSQETLWKADIAKNPGTPVGWAFLGDIYRDQGNRAEAETAYHRSFELRDRIGFYPESHNNYARLLSDRGALAEAKRQYRLVLRDDPAQFTALCNLGEIQLRADSTRAEAIALLRRATMVKADDFIPWANLAEAYRLAGRPDSALAAIDRAIRLRPDLEDLKASRRELTGGS